MIVGHDRPSARLLAGISVGWLGLSLIGDVFPGLLIPARLAESASGDATATVLGLVTFCALLAGMLVQPFAGVLSDRLKPRFGRVSFYVAGSCLTVAALVAFAGAQGVTAIGAMFVLVVVCAAIAQAAQQTFLPELIRRSWRGRASGVKGMVDVGGAFAGFLILGAVLASFGADAAVALVAIVVGACAALVALLARGWPRNEHERPAVEQTATRGAQPRHLLLVVVGSRFLFLLATFAVGRFLYLFISDRLDLAPADAAAMTASVFALLTLLTAVASFPAGWLADRIGRRELMVGGAIVAAAGAALLASAGAIEGIVVGGGVMSLGSAAFVGANWATTSDVVRLGHAGRDMGIANIGTAGAAAGAGLLGPLADAGHLYAPALGYGLVFYVAVGLFLLSAVVAWRVGRERGTHESVVGRDVMAGVSAG